MRTDTPYDQDYRVVIEALATLRAHKSELRYSDYRDRLGDIRDARWLLDLGRTAAATDHINRALRDL